MKPTFFLKFLIFTAMTTLIACNQGGFRLHQDVNSSNSEEDDENDNGNPLVSESEPTIINSVHHMEIKINSEEINLILFKVDSLASAVLAEGKITPTAIFKTKAIPANGICAFVSEEPTLPIRTQPLTSSKISETLEFDNNHSATRHLVVTFSMGNKNFQLHCQRAGFATLNSLKTTLGSNIDIQFFRQ